MTKLTGGQAVVDALRMQGTECVLGLIGSAGMEIFDGLHGAKDIRFVGVRDERTGVHMADGYARMTGKAGVFLAGQNGPGATNLVTGLAQAQAAYSPVVALAGLLSSAHAQRDAFQEVDQHMLFKPVTKKTYTLTQTARIPEMLGEAYRTALSPRQGPVLLNLPRDLLADTFEAPDFPAPGRAYIAEAFTGPRAMIERAAQLLRHAQRPVIIAGGGVKSGRHGKDVARLAELLNAPVVMSPGHGDAISYMEPVYAGQVGPRGNPVATDLAKRADVILAIGTRLGFNTTFYQADALNPAADIIQVEVEPTAIGRFYPVAVGIFGDAGCVTDDLLSALDGHQATAGAREWMSAFVEQRRALLASRDEAAGSGGDPIQPQYLYRTLRDVLPDDTLYTMDAGTLCLQATDQLRYVKTPSLFTPLDFGLVGFSYACGLGAKLGDSSRTVVSLMGDGGFGMACSELGTAVEHGINTVCIVMNNGCWGAEKAYQRDFFGERYIGADVRNPPFDKLAELWGAKGFRVDSAASLAKTVDAAIRCGQPAVVDVQVDPNALYSFRRDSFKNRAGKQ
jgi:acetolactate synthase-1/2/3 large subunit/sulfoacetaldehyde acetyltransferase